MRVAGETDSAMTLYQEALLLIEAGDYKDEKAHLLTSIAILYANTGHLDEARDYADRAVEAANESMDMDMIIMPHRKPELSIICWVIARKVCN
jgi:tetratricopeptide (TPR) repeat protein